MCSEFQKRIIVWDENNERNEQTMNKSFKSSMATKNIADSEDVHWMREWMTIIGGAFIDQALYDVNTQEMFRIVICMDPIDDYGIIRLDSVLNDCDFLIIFLRIVHYCQTKLHQNQACWWCWIDVEEKEFYQCLQMVNSFAFVILFFFFFAIPFSPCEWHCSLCPSSHPVTLFLTKSSRHQDSLSLSLISFVSTIVSSLAVLASQRVHHLVAPWFTLSFHWEISLSPFSPRDSVANMFIPNWSYY